MRSIQYSFLMALLLLLPHVATADFDRGSEAYSRGDFASAMKEFRAAAEQGDSAAQFNLGVMYARGRGVGLGASLTRPPAVSSSVTDPKSGPSDLLVKCPG